jgi:hypothetical protein
MIIDSGLQGEKWLKNQAVIRDPIGALNGRKFPPAQAICGFGMDVKGIFPSCRFQRSQACQAIGQRLGQIDFKYRLAWHSGLLGQAD